jgi:hypothetical protein
MIPAQLTPESVFLTHITRLVKNLLVEDKNYTNGYYTQRPAAQMHKAVDDLILASKDKGRFILDEIERIKHLIEE